MRKALVRQRTSAMKMFAAPTSGWIANQNLAINSPKSLNGAYLLENFFPTATGIEIRKGSDVYATVGAGTLDVSAVFDYNNGNNQKLFAATADTIYDITLNTTGGDPVVTGLTGGDWVVTQFATTGGIFLIAVNGKDPMQLYDGVDWFPITENDVYTLKFDAQTVNFVEGQTLTGVTSGATGYILHVDDNGTTGTIYLTDVVGAFVDNEIITSTPGSATTNGVLQDYYVGISGVNTANLSYVWVYKNRIFFIEKESFNIWYLGIDSVGGPAEVFPMGGEFYEGGKILIGSSWSLGTSGDGGLSEQCVFISTEGQVVAFQGLAPDSAATWSRVGGYKIGKPLGQLAWFRAGGDLIISTDIGAVPLSQALNVDIAALAPLAVSYPIETEWNEAVYDRRVDPWTSIVWPEQQMVIIAPPATDQQSVFAFVANARTGAWTRFTDWKILSMCIFQSNLYFGSTDGKVVQAYITGQDQEQPFTATFVTTFNDLGSPASIKVPKVARCVARGTLEAMTQISIMTDYVLSLPSPPAASITNTESSWGTGVWGTAVWGGRLDKSIQQQWRSVSGSGYSLAPAVQMTSGSPVPLDTEIIRLEMTYETTDIVT